MEWILKIFIWIVFALLLTAFPASVSSTRQRYRLTAVITYSLIGINVFVYLMMVFGSILYNPGFYSRVINSWGFVPYYFINPLDREVHNPFVIFRTYLTLITGLFLHGGFFHILGNMYYLHLFGPDIETGQNIKFYGRSKKGYNSLYPFLFFYIICGIGATIAHTIVFGLTEAGKIVLIGASGAISGILGAFLCKLWKDYRKITLYMLFLFKKTVSANLYLLFWIVLQLALAIYYGKEASVSYVAHLGGAFVGMILSVFVFPWTDIIVKSKTRGWFGKRVKTSPYS